MGGHGGPVSVVPALLWVDGRQRQEVVWTVVVQIACGCSSGQQEMLSQRKLSADAEAVLQPPHVCAGSYSHKHAHAHAEKKQD